MSELVTDMGRLRSDLGPIKIVYFTIAGNSVWRLAHRGERVCGIADGDTFIITGGDGTFVTR